MECSDRFGKANSGRAAVTYPLPRGEEYAKPRGLNGFDLMAESSKRPAAKAAQHVEIDPLQSAAAGLVGARCDTILPLQPPQHLLNQRLRSPEITGSLLGSEWGMGAGKAADDIAEGIGYMIEQRFGDPGRWLNPKRIPES